MSILTKEKLFAASVSGVEIPERIPDFPMGRARKTPLILPVTRAPQSIPVPGISRSIEVKFASTESEWDQAFELAAANYQARGYETPGIYRLRFTPYHALPETHTIVAKFEGQVVATFSGVMDNTLLGLPMEEIYANEIADLRREGRRMAEVTTLADSGLGVREFIQVFLTMIKIAMQYHRQHGGDTPVIVVNPRHRPFYTKILGFERLGPLRTYAAVQDHPAEAFWIDYDLLKVKAPKVYEDIFGKDLPSEVLTAPILPRRFVRQFSLQSSLCDPEEIERILLAREGYGSVRRW